MPTLRLLLCDDHTIVRAGVAALLAMESDLEVVGEVGDGEAAVRAARELKPDVVIIDIGMPIVDGHAAATRIKEEHPNMCLLGLTAFDDPQSLQQFLRTGASGYVLKRSAATELVHAIRTVARGDTYVDPAMAEHLVAGLRGRNRGADRLPDLSEREDEVMRCVALGMAMKEIAANLNLSPRTVETYKARAMQKLELTTRAEIVRYALQRGWLRA